MPLKRTSRSIAVTALATVLVLAGLTLLPGRAAASGTSTCYAPEHNVTLYVGAPLFNFIGMRAVDRVTRATSSLTFNGQEWVWQVSSNSAGACAEHDYIILNLFGMNVGYIDPPFAATAWE